MAKITYRYEVNGQTYQSSGISFAATETSSLLRGGPSRESAATTAAAHPTGSTIAAYYDPANPSEWVGYVWLLVIAGLASLLGIVPRTLGPRVPDPLVTGGILVGGLGALAAAGWFLNRALQSSSPEDRGTALAFGLIGLMILAAFARRLRGRA